VVENSLEDGVEGVRSLREKKGGRLGRLERADGKRIAQLLLIWAVKFHFLGKVCPER